MQSTKEPQLTSNDLHKINMFILQGYSEKEAEDAYMNCNRDQAKAALYLYTNQLNKKQQAHFLYMLGGTPVPDTLLALGDDFHLVKDIDQFFDIDEQLEYIKRKDVQIVNQLT